MSLTVGIATAILPNMPSDAEQGDTGNSTGVELGETLARRMNSSAVVYVPKLHM
jgi:hypothetical protein